MCATRYLMVSLFASLVAASCLLDFHARAQDTSEASPRPAWHDPNVSEPYKNWLREDVAYIVTDQERVEFRNLVSDKQRDEFILAFWERRNPNPGSAENTFKEVHYRRLAYANQHFAAGVPGWKTDRGRIYIIYGPPNSVESHSGITPPSEIWHYALFEGCSDVALNFTDKNGIGDYVLNDADTQWIRQACRPSLH